MTDHATSLLIKEDPLGTSVMLHYSISLRTRVYL